MTLKLYKALHRVEELLLQNCTGPLEYVRYKDSDWYKNRCIILTSFLPLCCAEIVGEYIMEEFIQYRVVQPLDVNMWKKFQGFYIQNDDGVIFDLCFENLIQIQQERLFIVPWQPIWKKDWLDPTIYCVPQLPCYCVPQLPFSSSNNLYAWCYDVSLNITRSDDNVYIHLPDEVHTGSLCIFLEGKWIPGCKTEFIHLLLSQRTNSQSETQPFLLHSF